MTRAADQYFLNQVTPPEGEPPEEWPDLIVVTGTIWGERRNKPLEDKFAFGMKLRSLANEEGWKQACFKFGCWEIDNPNRGQMEEPLRYDRTMVWIECLSVARIITSDKLPEVNGDG